MSSIPNGSILLPYRDPILGRMWHPSNTRFFLDETRDGGTTSLELVSGIRMVNSGATYYGHSRSFDGADDYQYPEVANPAAVDITSAPLAVFATVKGVTGHIIGYVVCKNLDSSLNTQYGIVLDFNGASVLNGFYIVFGGSTQGASPVNSIMPNKWYDLGFYWNGTSVLCFINGVEKGTRGTLSGALTSQPNFRICRRETADNYFKGNIDNVCIYATSDIQAILAHRKWIMRRKGILG